MHQNFSFMQHFSRLLTSLLLLLCLQDQLWAQQKSISFGMQAHLGSIIASEPEAAYVRDSYTSFIEASVRWQKDGSQPWHRANNYPQLGIAAFYGNPGSRQYIGKLAGVLPFIHFPVVRGERFKSGFRLGTGAAWIEKPYRVHTNHKNTLLGSSFNYFISLMLENEVKISKELSLSAGVSFSHLSNSDIKMPNFGLNLPTVSVGARWSPHETILEKKTLPRQARNLDWRVFATAGTKQTPWVGSPRYVVPALNAEVAKPLGASGAWGVGAALQYDKSLNSDPSGYALTKNGSKNLQAGVHFFYERKLGALSLPLQLGAYVLNPEKGQTFYQTLGIRYRIGKHWSAAFNLKAHGLQVDYTHAGFGYHF
ncbi:MAG: hypothetical protein JWP69_1901 [Flaviaesturariibacter sp.]|nr:hypothetical protein [Flaviaesturariibacter sp.]